MHHALATKHNTTGSGSGEVVCLSVTATRVALADNDASPCLVVIVMSQDLCEVMSRLRVEDR